MNNKKFQDVQAWLQSLPRGKYILLTSALPYVNGILHLGHIISTHLPMDITNRLFKLLRNHTVTLSGIDCYGPKVLQALNKTNIDIYDYIERRFKENKWIFDALAIKYDHFKKTTSKDHHQFVNNYFNQYIYKDAWSTWCVFICPKENKYIYNELIGNCAVCKSPSNSIGSICMKCHTFIHRSTDLNNIVCKSCKSKVHKKDKDVILLNINRFWNRILSSVNNVHFIWNFTFKMYFQSYDFWDKIISRKTLWNLPIYKLKDIKFYVWYEALHSYLSFLTLEEWWKFWEDDTSLIFQYMGKDNILFHTTMFHAILYHSKGWYRIPNTIIASHFLCINNKKFSKSDSIGFMCHGILKQDQYINDSIRMFLYSIYPENHDNNFNWKNFLWFYNHVFISKIINFFYRYYRLIQLNITKFKFFTYYHWKNIIPSLDLNAWCYKLYDNFIKTLVLIKEGKFQSSYQSFIHIINEVNESIELYKVYHMNVINFLHFDQLGFWYLIIISMILNLIVPWIMKRILRDIKLDKFMHMIDLHCIDLHAMFGVLRIRYHYHLTYLNHILTFKKIKPFLYRMSNEMYKWLMDDFM